MDEPSRDSDVQLFVSEKHKVTYSHLTTCLWEL